MRALACNLADSGGRCHSKVRGAGVPCSAACGRVAQRACRGQGKGALQVWQTPVVGGCCDESE